MHRPHNKWSPRPTKWLPRWPRFLAKHITLYIKPTCIYTILYRIEYDVCIYIRIVILWICVCVSVSFIGVNGVCFFSHSYRGQCERLVYSHTYVEKGKVKSNIRSTRRSMNKSRRKYLNNNNLNWHGGFDNPWSIYIVYPRFDDLHYILRHYTYMGRCVIHPQNTYYVCSTYSVSIWGLL